MQPRPGSSNVVPGDPPRDGKRSTVEADADEVPGSTISTRPGDGSRPKPGLGTAHLPAVNLKHVGPVVARIRPGHHDRRIRRHVATSPHVADGRSSVFSGSGSVTMIAGHSTTGYCSRRTRSVTTVVAVPPQHAEVEDVDRRPTANQIQATSYCTEAPQMTDQRRWRSSVYWPRRIVVSTFASWVLRSDFVERQPVFVDDARLSFSSSRRAASS